VAEISVDGTAPSVISAVHNATGVWFRDLPLTKDKLQAGLKK
jgi:putative selenate reductase molybdopterin-binding subunit